MKIDSIDLFGWRYGANIEITGGRAMIEITLSYMGPPNIGPILPAEAEPVENIKIICISAGKSQLIEASKMTILRARRGYFDKIIIFSEVSMPAECSIDKLVFTTNGRTVELNCD